MSQIKGRLGEDRVAYILKSLPEPDYRIGNNVLIKTDAGKTVQYDHIVVSIYGIFIIETKNMAGIIKGNPKASVWEQDVNGKKYKMYNPIRQNYGHVVALQNLLGVDHDITSIICFTERCDLDIEKPWVPVVHPLQLVDTVKRYKDIVFSYSQVEIIIDIIRRAVIAYRRGNRRHADEVSIIRAAKELNWDEGKGFTIIWDDEDNLRGL